MQCIDTSATESVWNQFSARLRAFIHYRVSDQTATEDILQNTFLRIHTNLCTVRQPHRLESWVFQITRHAIADYYRSHHETTELDEASLIDEPEGEPDASVRLASSLDELVQMLPEPYLEALLLTEYQGWSQQALADHAGISLSAAKSRVQRARQKIKDMLLACCHIELDRRGAIIDYYERCCCCSNEPRKPASF